MKWNKPTTRPNDGQRVVAINHGGAGAIVGVYDAGVDLYTEGVPAPAYDSVTCAITGHDVWWEDVTAWIDCPAPGDSV